MSSGFKDWDVPVNIRAQDLAQVINRPTYGSLSSLVYQDAILGDAETSLGTITGIGQVYGGYINVNAASSNTSWLIKVIIDGVTVTGISPASLKVSGLINPYNYLPHLLLYDTVNHIHTLGFSYGVTFETSLELKFTRKAGLQSNVTLVLLYAVI